MRIHCRAVITQWMLTGAGWSMTKELWGHDLTHSSPRTRLVHCSASCPVKSLNWEMLHAVPSGRTPPAIYGNVVGGPLSLLFPLSLRRPLLTFSFPCRLLVQRSVRRTAFSAWPSFRTAAHADWCATLYIELDDWREARNTDIENTAVLHEISSFIVAYTKSIYRTPTTNRHLYSPYYHGVSAV